MTTVNAQVDNDIYVCSRRAGLVRIEAPNGNVYLSRREHCGKRLFERLLPRHGYVNETQSHRLYTRLVQVAGIAESKLAAHESAAQRVLAVSNDLLSDLARALAAVANECCYRSDGWEEHLAGRFEGLLREAFPPAPSSEAPTAA